MSLKNIAAKSSRVVAGLAAVSLVSAIGIATTPALAASKPAALKKSDLVMVASVINTTNPYMAANIKGAQVLSKKLGIPLKIVDSQGSSQTEISKIQAILAGGKKVIMFVNTVASSDTPTIVNAVKAAGGFVTIWWNKPDSYEPWNVGNNFVAFQKHSGVESGKCTADMLAKSIGGQGGIIALPGVQDSTTSKTRVAGLEYQLASKYPGVKILEEQPSGWDPQLAYTNTKALITKYGSQIKGVWTADDGMQDGAIQAFKEAGLLDKVKFVSDGLYPETIDNMKNNLGNGAIVGETFHRGWAASAIGLYTAYLAATGKIDPSKLSHDKRDSLFNISCVTPQNYTQFTKWDNNVNGWVDSLIKNGPWNTAPFQLASGGPEKLPTITK
jgi:ribose transport system substrate-binding protein